jgi:hypothetical protein
LAQIFNNVVMKDTELSEKLFAGLEYLMLFEMKQLRIWQAVMHPVGKMKQAHSPSEFWDMLGE